MIPSGAPDLNTQKKFIKFIAKTIQKAIETNDVVLFLDPVHQVHNVQNGYCWQLKGGIHTKQVATNSGRKRLTIIGAINPVTHQPTILTTTDTCDQYMLLAFLAEIRKDYPTEKTIYVFLDNARYNHSKLVATEAKKLHIKLLFLPPYSPNLNLIERLWKFMKKKITANKYYKTFDEFIRVIHDFFKHISQYDVELKQLLTLKFEII